MKTLTRQIVSGSLALVVCLGVFYGIYNWSRSKDKTERLQSEPVLYPFNREIWLANAENTSENNPRKKMIPYLEKYIFKSRMTSEDVRAQLGQFDFEEEGENGPCWGYVIGVWVVEQEGVGVLHICFDGNQTMHHYTVTQE